MSAKWRAIQHRHRYTYNAVVFPDSYLHSFSDSDISSSSFLSQLKTFTSLTSVHAQVNHAKSLASAFSDLLLTADESLASRAAKLYLEVLFLDNSLPLHRTLVSGLAKTRAFHSVLSRCFRQLCAEYGGGGGGGRGKRFRVSRTALSVMGTPKLGYLVDVVEECAVLVAWDVVGSLDGVVSETEGWARPSPMVMEQCQEALSCLYYLLQRFPSKFKDLGPDSKVLGRSLSVVLSILKSLAFSRDCFVAAGVGFCAALQVCLSPEDLGLVIIQD